VYSSVRPESVTTVEADDRDRWVVTAAEATLERVALLAAALDRPERGDDLRATLRDAGVRESLAAGVPLAIERYDTGRPYLEAVRRTAVAALELVAGDREQVEPLSVEPGATGDATLGPLPPTPLDDAATPGPATEPPGASGEATDPEQTAEPEPGSEPEPEQTVDPEPEPEPEQTADPEPEPEPERTVDPEPERTAEPESGPTAPTAETTGAGTAGDELGGFDDGGELGDFDAGGDDGTDPLGAAEFDDDEMYELDEDERREVEAEFGTEFSTGAEVDEPGTADIDVPETVPGEGGDEPASEADAAGDGEVEPASEPDPASGADATDDGEVDLEDAAVEAMTELDDGDGAERERVVAVLVDRHGADPDAAADAIQDALMGGRCYEPDEDRLKAI
jgi:outer membrane biosynthesis protein TonB